jgi:DNA-binding NarL/FixJ family response regulator
MAQPKQVFLVDDHPLVREWLTNLINKRPDLKVCGEAGTAPEARQKIGLLQPDIAIVDITLASGSGIELIKDLHTEQPALAVLVLTMHDESVYALRALRAGARGYIMKCEATTKIIEGIRTVLEGRLFVSAQVTAQMAEKFANQPRKPGSPIELLSDRELEVFQLLGRGLSTRQIADQLHISFKTVQAFCARIKDKLQLDNVTELLREAIRWEEGKGLENFRIQ